MIDFTGIELFDESLYFDGTSCAVVGNSGRLLSEDLGELIDSHDNVIRCNLAITEGFEKHAGAKTTIRMANCHLFNCIKDNPTYLKHLHDCFPNFDRYFLSKQHGITIIAKPDINRSEFASYISQIKSNNNKFAIIHPIFYDKCCKHIGTKDATSGILAIIIACALFDNVSCFGFDFYDPKYDKHYYEKIPDDVDHKSHNLSGEAKFAKTLADEGIIKWC